MPHFWGTDFIAFSCLKISQFQQKRLKIQCKNIKLSKNTNKDEKSSFVFTKTDD